MSSLFNGRGASYRNKHHRERLIEGALATAIVGAAVLIALVLLDRYL
jgi:hypothetical protein